MSATPPTQADLAAALAGRVLHDMAGQASPLLAAFDLLADPSAGEMREEALALAEQSARRLVRRLALQRAVLTAGEPLSPRAVETAAQDLFADSRASLVLRLTEAAPPLANRVLLALLQIAQGAAATTVSVTVTAVGEGFRLEMMIDGPRAKLRDEECRGLRGEPMTEGQAHRWALAYWLWSLCRKEGGSITIDESDGRVSIAAEAGIAESG